MTDKEVGRPTKAALAANTKGNRKKVGRPAGDAAIINAYKAMMITSPKSKKVLKKILDAALDDDHKGQQAAWKLIVDRILPVGLFDAGESKKPSGISITINTVDAKEVNIEAEAEEAEYEDISDE